MNSKSISVMTGPTSFILQAKIIWQAVLYDSCWFYDFDNASFQNIKKNYFGFFCNFRSKYYPTIFVLIAPIGLNKRLMDHR